MQGIRLPVDSDDVQLILTHPHKALLRKNAKVYLAARSEERAKGAIAELVAETGKEAIWLELDLSSFQSIEKAATEFRRHVVARYSSSAN